MSDYKDDPVSLLARILDAFESEIWVRNTKFDDDPAWAIKLVRPLRDLAIAVQVVAEQRRVTTPQAQGVKEDDDEN